MSIMVNLNHGNRWLLTSSDQEFLSFAVRDWISCANKSIESKGSFFVALSGGSTPLAIFSELVKKKSLIADISKIFFFWGDERCVPPETAESNYGNAMAILRELGAPEDHFFRMKVENPEGDVDYEKLLTERVPESSFDFIMLGVGDDGHTASLFPKTKALDVKDRLVVFNDVPQHQSKRMTLTFPCLQRGKHNVFYVKGDAKKAVVKSILETSILSNEEALLREKFPAELVGTENNPAFWFLAPDTYDLADYERIPPERKLVLP
ncbi:6-phosphogluconolactonase [Chlamydiifrater phoenicopteri]|uniref:6-phosphogluconolactonase n=1 Tax=Chlamydiifrater phoenicopteri TaxID=2681469 RepID=UPI001BD1140E|nr:6-phosphogluconolactonase [Chlamydiifrater phoenicopteri]